MNGGVVVGGVDDSLASPHPDGARIGDEEREMAPGEASIEGTNLGEEELWCHIYGAGKVYRVVSN